MWSEQGTAVALSGDGTILAIGAPNYNGQGLGPFGIIYIFAGKANIWIEQTRVYPANAIGNPQIGHNLAISSDGSSIFVGGVNDNNGIGATFVFLRNGDDWIQNAKLIGTGASGEAYQGVGLSLSKEGKVLAVGGNFDNMLVGAVWIFVYNGTQWIQQGPKLIGTNATSPTRQGTSTALSLNGQYLVIGGPNDASLTGAVWMWGLGYFS